MSKANEKYTQVEFRDISISDWMEAISLVRSCKDETKLASRATDFKNAIGAPPSENSRFSELCLRLRHLYYVENADLDKMLDARREAGLQLPSGKSSSDAIMDREDLIERDVDILDMNAKEPSEEMGILTQIASYKHSFSFPEDTDWIIPDWLQPGELHILVGPGGEGKSRLAIQLMAAIAEDPAHPESCSGIWLERNHKLRQSDQRIPTLRVESAHRCKRILYVMLEDGIAKLHRRLMMSVPYLGGTANGAQERFTELMGDRMDIMPARGGGALWMSTGKYGESSDWTPLGREVIKRAIGHYHPQGTPASLLVIDTLALAYGDNENDRARVSAFTTAIQYYCERHGIACLIVAHPSKNKDAEYSGSTSWFGNARGMWELKRHGTGEGQDEHPTLTLLKSSEGQAGAKLSIESRWTPGTFGHRMIGAPIKPPNTTKIPDEKPAPKYRYISEEEYDPRAFDDYDNPHFT